MEWTSERAAVEILFVCSFICGLWVHSSSSSQQYNVYQCFAKCASVRIGNWNILLIMYWFRLDHVQTISTVIEAMKRARASSICLFGVYMLAIVYCSPNQKNSTRNREKISTCAVLCTAVARNWFSLTWRFRMNGRCSCWIWANHYQIVIARWWYRERCNFKEEIIRSKLTHRSFKFGFEIREISNVIWRHLTPISTFVLIQNAEIEEIFSAKFIRWKSTFWCRQKFKTKPWKNRSKRIAASNFRVI